MGHARIDETMLYVHVAQGHRRPTLPELLAVAAGSDDPDKGFLRMLGARGDVAQPSQRSPARGHVVDTKEESEEINSNDDGKWALHDSNLWPLAPEANALSN